MLKETQASPDRLTPLPYQKEVVTLLKKTEPELWRWASSAETQAEHADDVRTHLLKKTYRLDVDGHPELHEQARQVAQRLGVTCPITLYQGTGLGMNAALWHLPAEAHIVFTGPVLTTLKGAELKAVLAHELAHYRLWEIENGDFQVADRLMLSAAHDPRAMPGHAHTARRLRLYTEIFADRGSYVGCGDLHAAVAMLVKIETGLAEVNAPSYLRQADEIFAREDATAKGLNHPETFIRARALCLWAEEDASLDEWLTATIEGPLAIDELDLAGQNRMRTRTQRFLEELLRPHWFQSEPVLAHARAFFPDFKPAKTRDAALVDAMQFTDAATREYLCYLLLDFAAIDPELEELPLAAALGWSQALGIGEMFEKLAAKELGLGKRQLGKVKKEAAELLAKVEAAS